MNQVEQGDSIHPMMTDDSPATRSAVDLLPELVEELGQLVSEIRNQDFAKLEEAVGTFARAPQTNSGFPTVRPVDCRKITEAFAVYLEAHRTRFVLNDPLVPGNFFRVLDQFATSDVRTYPNELVQLQLVRIQALILAGRNEEALEVSTPIAERPYLVEGDISSLRRLYELDTLARLNAGRHAEVDTIALGRLLLLVRTQRQSARRLFGWFFPMLSISTGIMPQYSWLEGVVRFAARLRLTLRIRKKKQTIFLRILEWPISVLAVWTLRHLAWRKRYFRLQILEGAPFPSRVPWTFKKFVSLISGKHQNKAGGILVTRAMGGLGDIIMMTPGLTALAKSSGRPVYFATKKQFFPVLENNPDIHLLDIDEVIDLRRFRRWVNLSFCPAARYESKVTPKIRRGRVELFARAMGVKRKALELHGWRPTCHLTAEQLEKRDEYRARFRMEDLPIIGVQPYSRETYRNYPRIFEAMSRMAVRARIVFFHTAEVPVAAHPNIQQVYGQSLRETLSAIAACDYFVSVDSAFLHIAAAFDIPTLGIFGPTDGRLRASHHPRSVIIDAPKSFSCAPCWRNEDMSCFVTGGQVSVCLSSIPVDEVTEGMDTLMHKYSRSISAA